MAAKKTAAAKNAKSTKKTAAKAAIKHPNHRVWRLPITLREQLQQVRANREIKVKDLYVEAVDRVAEITEALLKMGLSHSGEESGPVRVEMTEASLAKLRYCSAQTGIDQRLLLQAALTQIANVADVPKPRRRKAAAK